MKKARWAASDEMEVLGSAASGALAGSARARLVGMALVGAIACGGSAFSREGAGGGAIGGAAAGAEAVGVGGVSSEGGGPAGGQGVGAEGGDGVSGAEAGSGGAATVLSCSELGGLTYAEHCYVDATTEAVNQLDAAAACADLASRAGRPAQLLVLGSVEEQSFIIGSFLSEITDAWLGLTCSSIDHPVLTDCYCRDCEDGLLLEKRATWSWADGSSASFGWSGNNPDGAVRCSALAYNPTIATWGWVDRSCLSTVHQIDDFPPHSYRVLCELP